MKIRLFPICILWAMLASSLAIASPLPEFPFITVSGESFRDVEPDTVEISFYIEAFATQSEQAASLQKTAVNNALNVLAEFSIDAQQISSSEIAKRVIRQRDEDYNELAILGYEVGQPVSVKLESLENYNEITNKLIALDLLSNIESEFDVKNRQAIELELVKEAGANAMNSAQQLAQGLDVTIESVYGVTDGSGFPSFFASFGTENLRMRVTGASMQRETTFFVPKTIQIRKRINVIYKIQSAQPYRLRPLKERNPQG